MTFLLPPGIKGLKLQHGGYLCGDETNFGKNEEAHMKRSSSKISGKGDFKRFELQNKQSPLSVHKLQ